MASVIYHAATTKIIKADLDFDTATFRLKALMSNTTCLSQLEAANLAAFTTIDEYNGSGYTEATLSGITISTDTTNHYTKVTWTSPVSWGTTVGAGTRQITAALLYVRVDGTTSNDYPVACFDCSSSPVNGTGSSLAATIASGGLIQVV